jgi:predicted phage-related endonuclease
MNFNNFDKDILEIDIADIQSMSEHDYALARRKGFGASDLAILLNVNPYSKPMDLIAQKRSTELTEEELAIGKKDAVRKGKDLEPLIIDKASKILGLAIHKPPHQYRFKEFPYLKINFDGVAEEDGITIPIECKFVTTYGDKYYNRAQAHTREFGNTDKATVVPMSYTDLTSRIIAKAEAVGIPPYYYVQLQDQMMGLDAPHGYLAALHDKGWELCIYKAYKDEELQSQIKLNGYKYWSIVEQ